MRRCGEAGSTGTRWGGAGSGLDVLRVCWSRLAALESESELKSERTRTNEMRSRERTESLSLSASSRSVPTSWCKLEPLQQLQQGPPASPGQPASCALPAPPTSASAPSTLASEPPPAMAADEPDQPLSTSFTHTHAFLAGAQELTAVDFDLDPPADLDHDEAKTLASLCNMVRPSSLPAFHDRRTHRPAPTPLAARRVPRAVVPPRPGPRSPRRAPPRGPARPGPPP